MTLDEFARANLVAHQLDGLRRGTDESKAGGGDRARKAGIFGQKAITGMNGLGPRGQSRLDDLRAVQIGRNRRGTCDFDRLIGQPDRGAVGVGRRDTRPPI